MNPARAGRCSPLGTRNTMGNGRWMLFELACFCGKSALRCKSDFQVLCSISFFCRNSGLSFLDKEIAGLVKYLSWCDEGWQVRCLLASGSAVLRSIRTDPCWVAGQSSFCRKPRGKYSFSFTQLPFLLPSMGCSAVALGL